MLCQICQKKEATVHFTEIAEDNVIKLHICEECAKSKGIGIKSDADLGDFLSSLTEMEVLGSEAKLKCPQCGISLRDFRREGRLGCGRCYEVFEKSLLSLIRALHKEGYHTGKCPSTHRVDTLAPALKDLHQALREAVKNEEYEKAAQLRDKIRQIEKQPSKTRKASEKEKKE